MQVTEKNLENLSKSPEKIVKKRKSKKWKAEETDFSKLLKKTRCKHVGFTQQMVANYAKVPRCRISQWENGAKIPSKKNLDKLIKYYTERSVIDFYTEKILRSLHARAVDEKKLRNSPCMCGIWKTFR